jgi:hypothetical protein
MLTVAVARPAPPHLRNWLLTPHVALWLAQYEEGEIPESPAATPSRDTGARAITPRFGGGGGGGGRGPGRGGGGGGGGSARGGDDVGMVKERAVMSSDQLKSAARYPRIIRTNHAAQRTQQQWRHIYPLCAAQAYSRVLRTAV